MENTGIDFMQTALVVIDVQNDFCPGGALAVNDGDSIVSLINSKMNDYDIIALTQDWHPVDHSSFASSQKGKSPLETVEMPYGTQVLWPDHCVQGTRGAAFHPKLNTDPANLIVRKGYNPEIDSYSAFFENDHKTPTGLHGYLKTRGVIAIDLVGLATDFCVNFSAVDAATLGYKTRVFENLTKAINLAGSLDAARSAMIAAGVTLES
jgi:nicotinamidase/pyrazinamidase